ncbi:hypothetical protein J6590_030479 [Homalodisca vitripennis]|nr:hypothetical protein J6590_030479 [Homalodisca vitripennis]
MAVSLFPLHRDPDFASLRIFADIIIPAGVYPTGPHRFSNRVNREVGRMCPLYCTMYLIAALRGVWFSSRDFAGAAPPNGFYCRGVAFTAAATRRRFHVKRPHRRLTTDTESESGERPEVRKHHYPDNEL